MEDWDRRDRIKLEVRSFSPCFFSISWSLSKISTLSTGSGSAKEMHVAHLESSQACLSGCFQALPGLLSGCGRQVDHPIFGMKGQQTVRNVGVQ